MHTRTTAMAVAVLALVLSACSSKPDQPDATPTATATATPTIDQAAARQACVDAWADVLQADPDAGLEDEPVPCEACRRATGSTATWRACSSGTRPTGIGWRPVWKIRRAPRCPSRRAATGPGRSAVGPPPTRPADLRIGTSVEPMRPSYARGPIAHPVLPCAARCRERSLLPGRRSRLELACADLLHAGRAVLFR